MSVPYDSLENCWIDLDKIWYGHYAIGGYLNTHFLIPYSQLYKYGTHRSLWGGSDANMT
jgi:hypothetical protein